MLAHLFDKNGNMRLETRNLRTLPQRWQPLKKDYEENPMDYG